MQDPGRGLTRIACRRARSWENLLVQFRLSRRRAQGRCRRFTPSPVRKQSIDCRSRRRDRGARSTAFPRAGCRSPGRAGRAVAAAIRAGAVPNAVETLAGHGIGAGCRTGEPGRIARRRPTACRPACCAARGHIGAPVAGAAPAGARTRDARAAGASALTSDRQRATVAGPVARFGVWCRWDGWGVKSVTTNVPHSGIKSGRVMVVPVCQPDRTLADGQARSLTAPRQPGGPRLRGGVLRSGVLAPFHRQARSRANTSVRLGGTWKYRGAGWLWRSCVVRPLCPPRHPGRARDRRRPRCPVGSVIHGGTITGRPRRCRQHPGRARQEWRPRCPARSVVR